MLSPLEFVALLTGPSPYDSGKEAHENGAGASSWFPDEICLGFYADLTKQAVVAYIIQHQVFKKAFLLTTLSWCSGDRKCC